MYPLAIICFRLRENSVPLMRLGRVFVLFRLEFRTVRRNGIGSFVDSATVGTLKETIYSTLYCRQLLLLIRGNVFFVEPLLRVWLSVGVTATGTYLAAPIPPVPKCRIEKVRAVDKELVSPLDTNSTQGTRRSCTWGCGAPRGN